MLLTFDFFFFLILAVNGAGLAWAGIYDCAVVLQGHGPGYSVVLSRLVPMHHCVPALRGEDPLQHLRQE